MKKPTHSRLFLLPTMAFALSAFFSTAHAKMPHSDLFPSFSESEESTIFTRLQDYKNAKGESLGKLIQTTQGNQPNLWSHLDSTDDQIEGTSTAKAYLSSKMPAEGKEIIVAVIDSGVDINHEDLKGKVWTNYAELNGAPGVDDDSNGFVDDVHGWNFLGAKDGTSVNGTTLEVTREYARLKKKKAAKKLTKTEAVYFAKISAQFDSELKDAQDDLRSYQELMSAIKLLKLLGLKEETLEAVQAIESKDPEVISAKKLASFVFSNPQIGSSAGLQEIIDDASVKVKFQYNPNFDSSKIVGDNPKIMDEQGYGNNDVTGPDALHGTHVAGIIGANRDNGIGVLGQSDSVKIMSIRAVPNGDERDKDVANAILYAVKNGAKVINMSFGKEYSPQKNYVDYAVSYAEKHGVILVHAAGNSGKSTETGANNFPNKKILQLKSTAHEATNWIEVGASSKLKNVKLPANFSNYGKTSVDLFAPGTAIMSTVPGSQYRELQGTSMASPEVAGVAALLMSRFSDRPATDIISAMMNTTTQYPGLIVNLPGTRGAAQISFSQLSKTGGIVNTLQALQELAK